MDTCQICKHDFSKLRFKTGRIKICTRCVNTLNEFNEPADQARGRVREMLARGMERNAQRDLESVEEWKRNKAGWTLKHLFVEADRAVDEWITKLLADSKNSTKDFKMLRAERRGLLRMTGGDPYTYPSNWSDQARRIRAEDERCSDCGDTEFIQDVHHIIHLSRFGTNRQENLVRLCRPCHQKLHGFEFDVPESHDPESLSPIQFPKAVGIKPNALPTASPLSSINLQATEEPRRFETQCPRCGKSMTTTVTLLTGQVVRCSVCDEMFRHGIAAYSIAETKNFSHQQTSVVEHTPQDAYLAAVIVAAEDAEKPPPQKITTSVPELGIRRTEEVQLHQVTRFETLPPPVQGHFPKDMAYFLAVLLVSFIGICILLVIVAVLS